MKIVILHGTGADHTENWFPWLKDKLEKLGHEVWVPDLPDANLPDLEKYNKFLLSSKWDFNDNLIIGHSSGAVEITSLLQELPDDVTVNTAVLVGVFRGDLGWKELHGVNGTFEYPKIKARAGKFIVIHADNDPYCPLDGAEWIADQLDASLRIFHGFGHFSKNLDPRFDMFPELLEIIKEEII